MSTRTFRAQIDTQLPVFPRKVADPQAQAELAAIYNAFINLQLGVDRLHRGTGLYDAATSYGQIVNIYNSGGTHVRLADAAAGIVYPALAFCPVTENVLINEQNEVQFFGPIYGLTGIVPGTIYYLSDATPGGYITSKPVGAGKIVQPIGFGVDSTTLFFNPTLLYDQL